MTMDAKVKDALDKVRASAQELHAAISDAAAKRGGAMKVDLEIVQKKAKAGADSARSSMAAQNDAAKKHLGEAVKRLEAGQKDAAEGLKAPGRTFQTAVRETPAHARASAQETHPAVATAVGVGIGALLGALAGPAGAAVGAAGGAAIGAATGGAVGITTDLVRADTRDQAGYESSFVIDAGQSAVIADVSEDSIFLVDERMRNLGGIVYRRAASDLRDDEWFDPDYLYPYEYIPPRYVAW